MNFIHTNPQLPSISSKLLFTNGCQLLTLVDAK
jgi:hypothetical protein